MAAADRLVESAASAVLSFYRDDAKRFLRDSEDTKESERFSTGGASVATQLWDMGDDLPYLKGVLDKAPLEKLEHYRAEASKHLADPANTPLEFSPTFGALNMYAVAVAARQMAHIKPFTPRTEALAALVVNHYRGGEWPELDGGLAHPYIAQRWFRAAEYIRYHDLTRPRGRDKASEIAAGANVKVQADTPDFAEEATRALRNGPLSGSALHEARRSYVKRAEAYLWEQSGIAAAGASSASNWLRYDPAGTCFALDILISGSSRMWADTDATRHVTEYEDLVQLSLRHVLTEMSPTGLLAYGLPFSYDIRGIGAFATSISGLAALARVLHQLFEDSRRSFYRNATYIRELLEANPDQIEALLRLPVAVEARRRPVRINGDGELSGWATDRAPSFTRIESWVSVDVLTFAVYLRLLVQEIAQFHTSEAYGAVEPSDARSWPYEPHRPARSPRRQPDEMTDPDAVAEGGRFSSRIAALAPTYALHEGVVRNLAQNPDSWDLERSSFLLFGPPGTAKSTLAKSVARVLNWHYLELTPSNFVEQGLEMIERRSREIFEELAMLRETVILFDELDSLLTDRDKLETGNILNFTVPAMLPKLQRLTRVAKQHRVLLIFATNYYDRLDAAMTRRGRIDERLVMLPPNRTARREMLAKMINPPVSDTALDLATDVTALAVYEELKQFAHEYMRTPSTLPEPRIGITPALYSSRVPWDERVARNEIRSTQRLGLEVAEVVGRLLDWPRKLEADTSPKELSRRLDALIRGLSDPRNAEWKDLCKRIRTALEPPVGRPPAAPASHSGPAVG